MTALDIELANIAYLWAHTSDLALSDRLLGTWLEKARGDGRQDGGAVVFASTSVSRTHAPRAFSKPFVIPTVENGMLESELSNYAEDRDYRERIGRHI